MIALIIILSIIILITILLLIPVYLNVRYIYSEKNGIAKVRLDYMSFKIVLVPRDKKPAKEKKKKQKPKEKKNKITAEKLKEYIDNVTGLWDDICEVLEIVAKRAIYIKEFSIYSKFGFDDPMVTGMATGIANTVAYNLLSMIDRCSNLQRWNVSLKPDFDNPQLSVRVHGIIKIKLVHIIVIVIKLIRIFFKVK